MSSRSSGFLLPAVTVFLLAAFISFGIKAITVWAADVVPPEIDWLFIPASVPADGPFAAWYSVNAPVGSGRIWLQLRICDEADACILAARKRLADAANVGLVTATRNLRPGDYTLEVLVLREDRLGVPRTVVSARRRVVFG